MSVRRPTRRLLALTIAIATTGCSGSRLDDLPRVPVSGTVTMDGQPLPEGAIQFSPTGDTSANAAGATGEIKGGAFSIPRESGPVPGIHRVSISHAEVEEIKGGKGRRSISEGRKRLGAEQIPAKYNTKSELKVEIGPGGATEMKFDLQSK